MSVCPNKQCRSLNTKQIETRHRSGKPNAIKKTRGSTPYTYRQRVCEECGLKFGTREYAIQDLLDFGKKGYVDMIDDLMKQM